MWYNTILPRQYYSPEQLPKSTIPKNTIPYKSYLPFTTNYLGVPAHGGANEAAMNLLRDTEGQPSESATDSRQDNFWIHPSGKADLLL